MRKSFLLLLVTLSLFESFSQIKKSIPIIKKTGSFKATDLLILKNYKDLYSLYPNQISEETVPDEDCETCRPPGKVYTIFKNTINEMKVDVDTKGKLLGISTDKNGKWEFPYGLKIGMKINDIELLNKKPFSFNKFETDNGGWINDWEGGALDKKGIGLGLKPKNQGNYDRYINLTGKSDDTNNKEFDIVISEIQLFEVIAP